MKIDHRPLLVLALGAIAVVAVVLLPAVPAAIAVAAYALLVLVVASRRPAPPTREAALAALVTDDALALRSMGELVRVLGMLHEGALLLGEDQVVLSVNDTAARILGRDREQMVGRSLIRAARDHELVQLLREPSPSTSEVTLSDGRRALASAAPLHLGPVRTLLTLQDVTALRRAERARQDLVANVSHELRTPISAALALAETLEGGVDDPAQAARFHQHLTAELERLKEIVERLLRLSRIESEAEEFTFEAIDPASVVQEAVEHVLPVAQRGEVTIEQRVRATRPVHGDRGRVVEVLTNLLDNALRFTPAGGTVSVAAADDEAMVRFAVRDEGPGILPSDRLRVFERFYTGEHARTAGGGTGTGIGLAIARHIVTRHGGAIWVADATPGATLCFTLPVAGPAADGER